jgi:hypothetical protein
MNDSRAILNTKQPKFDWLEIVGILLLMVSWWVIGYMIYQLSSGSALGGR